jgi:hypothetical protein
MGTPAPDAVKRLVDRFDQDRKVLLSGDYEEEQFSKAQTPHERESRQRQIAVTDRQIDALVYEPNMESVRKLARGDSSPCT